MRRCDDTMRIMHTEGPVSSQASGEVVPMLIPGGGGLFGWLLAAPLMLRSMFPSPGMGEGRLRRPACRCSELRSLSAAPGILPRRAVGACLGGRHHCRVRLRSGGPRGAVQKRHSRAGRRVAAMRGRRRKNTLERHMAALAIIIGERVLSRVAPLSRPVWRRVTQAA